MTFFKNMQDQQSYQPELESAFDLGATQTPNALAATAANEAQKKAVEQSIATSLGVGGTAAATGALPFLATPWGAAAMIGSQAVMQIAAQKAADARAKRQAIAQIEQNKGAQMGQGLDTILESYRGLR